MNSISERLDRLVKMFADGNAQAFAINAKIQQSTFHNYIRGTRLPNTESLINICKTYGVNLNWLLIGSGPMLLKDIPPFRCFPGEIYFTWSTCRYVPLVHPVHPVHPVRLSLVFLRHSQTPLPKTDRSNKKNQLLGAKRLQQPGHATINAEIPRISKIRTRNGTR